MRFAIFALLVALLAFNSASAFVFPDDVVRPIQGSMQWIGDRLTGNNNNNRRQPPSWREDPTRPPWRPLANFFGYNNKDNQRQYNQQQVSTMYPPHPKLVAQRPSYMGNSNKWGASVSSDSGFIPEITMGRMPEFKPEDYYPYGKK